MNSSNDCLSLCGCTAGKTAKQSRNSISEFSRVPLILPANYSSSYEFSHAPYPHITIKNAVTCFRVRITRIFISCVKCRLVLSLLYLSRLLIFAVLRRSDL